VKDPRVEKLARVMTEYSVELKKGQHVVIAGEPQAQALLLETYRAALRCGANPELQVSLPGSYEIFCKEASKAQLEWLSPVAQYRTKKIDAAIRIRSETNTRANTNCDPKKMAAHAKATRPLSKLFMNRASKGELAWVLTQWPTNASAQDAYMSLAEYEDFVFQACHLDDDDPVRTWKAISKSQQALTDKLNKTREVRIVAEDTDLTFSCEGRNWINCDGHYNFPDGEVFTGPVEKSVNGHVKFSFPAIHHSREVVDAMLEFKDGKVVGAEASKGVEFLREMIAMDKGSCYLGEAAIGTNYNIRQYTRNTLFDEKIGGTIHLALGAAYPETGSKNDSGLHWDMVCDMRNGGKIYADGQLIQENGVFGNKRYPQPPSSSRAGGTRKKAAKKSRKKTSAKKRQKS
jgi:aminopeptidase